MSTEALGQQFIYIPRTALIASLVFHLMIPLSWLTVKGLEALGFQIFPSRHLKEVYQEYVQVDLVGLPDIAVKDLEKQDATLPEAEKAQPAPEEAEDKMVLETKAQQAKEEAQRIKEAKDQAERKKALKQIEDDLKREAALKALSNADGKAGRQKLKGNILSKGNAVSGELGTPKDQYTAIVMAKIKGKFFIMEPQRNRGLSNMVHMELYPNGRVRSRRILKGSSDGLFDSSVLQAIDEAQPFPIPDDPSLIQGGITVTFRAEE